MASPSPPIRPVTLIIRDGWGENPHPEHARCNAVALADTPCDDELRGRWPHTLIRPCGEDVGLPAGTMGNSEVGHQNIGAGRVVPQELMRITGAIRDGSFFENGALRTALQHAAHTGGRVHLLGLVSDGKVHSDLDHLFALVELARRFGVERDRLLVHVIMDGRDTPPTAGREYVARLEHALDAAGTGRIASVMGRFHAMDRDNRWERVARAYACLTGRRVAHADLDGEGAAPVADSAGAAIERYYEHPDGPSRHGDEFIPPTAVRDPATGEPLPRVTGGDTVIFLNFRGDRPRELTRAFTLDDAEWPRVARGGFDRGARLENLHFCTMTEYERGLPVSGVAFQKPPKMAGILGEAVSRAGHAQFRCAETEKYPHVTFFFNDYREEPFDGEGRLLVPSPTDVATYDRRPEMSAHGVCAGVLERLEADDGEALIIVNFANPDMVGHTGQLDAVIRAVEVTDECTGKIVAATLARGGAAIITADHGNAEQLWDFEHDCAHTSHTTYDVPLIIAGTGLEGRTLRSGGRLADIAPTVLTLMGLDVPPEMTGRSLVEAGALRETDDERSETSV
jgi:2,3-bisphosphoglycerate-independent phosphoglycerate mutase